MVQCSEQSEDKEDEGSGECRVESFSFCFVCYKTINSN